MLTVAALARPRLPLLPGLWEMFQGAPFQCILWASGGGAWPWSTSLTPWPLPQDCDSSWIHRGSFLARNSKAPVLGPLVSRCPHTPEGSAPTLEPWAAPGGSPPPPPQSGLLKSIRFPLSLSAFSCKLQGCNAVFYAPTHSPWDPLATWSHFPTFLSLSNSSLCTYTYIRGCLHPHICIYAVCM